MSVEIREYGTFCKRTTHGYRIGTRINGPAE
jgi:hypothetical protein